MDTMCRIDAGGGEELEGGWTSQQCAALEEAYFRKVDPLLDNHWQVVAQHVPGKSAQECFNKIFEKYPTPPVQKGRQPRTAATVKPPTAAAARPTASLTTKTGGPMQVLLPAYSRWQSCSDVQQSMARSWPYETEGSWHGKHASMDCCSPCTAAAIKPFTAAAARPTASLTTKTGARHAISRQSLK